MAEAKKDKPKNLGWRKVDEDGLILEKTIVNHPSLFPFTKTISANSAEAAKADADEYDKRLDALNDAGGQ